MMEALVPSATHVAAQSDEGQEPESPKKVPAMPSAAAPRAGGSASVSRAEAKAVQTCTDEHDEMPVRYWSKWLKVAKHRLGLDGTA